MNILSWLLLPLVFISTFAIAEGESCNIKGVPEIVSGGVTSNMKKIEGAIVETVEIGINDMMILCDLFNEANNCDGKIEKMKFIANKYGIPYERFKINDAFRITCSMRTFVVNSMIVDISCFKKSIVDEGYDLNRIIRDGDFFGTSYDVARNRKNMAKTSQQRAHWMNISSYIKRNGGKKCKDIGSCEYK